MFRILLLATILGIATTAQAELTDFSIVRPGSDDPNNFSIYETALGSFDYRIVFGQQGQADWNLVVLVLSDENYLFTLNETTAWTFGADWNLIHSTFQDWKSDTVTLEVRQRNTVSTVSHTLSLHPPTELRSIDFTFTFGPATWNLSEYRINPTITYNVTSTIPEPSAAVLVLIAVTGMSNRRRRT
jgi:hypothetical protein